MKYEIMQKRISRKRCKTFGKMMASAMVVGAMFLGGGVSAEELTLTDLGSKPQDVSTLDFLNGKTLDLSDVLPEDVYLPDGTKTVTVNKDSAYSLDTEGTTNIVTKAVYNATTGEVEETEYSLDLKTKTYGSGDTELIVNGIGDDKFTINYTKTNNRTTSPASTISENFIGNSIYSTSSNGGAINNQSTTISSIEGDFIGNSASAPDSYSSYGGAIYNKGTISSIVGDFIGNRASLSSQSSNSPYSEGGAIYNYYKGNISSIVGDFIGNSATATSTKTSVYSRGGAIYNYKTIGSIVGDFIENKASTYTDTSNSSDSYGGAIYNLGTITSIVGDFIGNSASSSGYSNYYYYSYGGAIYNYQYSKISSIVGNFIGNSAFTTTLSYKSCSYSNGGAIYNYSY